jgi:hypothetical protein
MSRLVWTQKQDIGPSARTGHAMAFDSARTRVVLFGGDSRRSTLFNDTWEWDGEDWTQAQDIGPGAPSQHAMAYDEARQTARDVWWISQSATAAADTCNGRRGLTQVADTGPSARSRHAMAFDRTRGRIVLSVADSPMAHLRVTPGMDGRNGPSRKTSDHPRESPMRWRTTPDAIASCSLAA